MKIYVDKNALQDYTTKLIEKEKTIFATKNEVGSPLVASTVAGMTDHDKIYVYVGSETGYTSGNWYYWNGTAWTSGGVYNSEGFVLDDTLTSATEPAQAKAVGDKVSQLSEEITNITGAEPIQMTEGAYYNLSGTTVTIGSPTPYSTKRYALVPCEPGDVFTVSAAGGSTAQPYAFVDENGNILLKTGNSSDVTITKKILVAPADSAYLIINDYTPSDLISYKGRILGNVCFKYLGELPSGSSLDDLQADVVGFYMLPYSANYTGDPIGNSTRRILYIYSDGVTDTNYITGQTIVSFTTGKTYTRFYTYAGGWSNWKLTDSAALDAIADEYSDQSTYVVGDMAQYKGDVYQATQTITTAEAFNSSKWVKRPLGDIGLIYRGWLEAGADLNTVKSDITGFFMLAYSSTYINDPIGNGTRRILFVYSSGVNDSDTITAQTIVSFTTGKTYTRYYTTGGGWTAWKLTESTALDAMAGEYSDQSDYTIGDVVQYNGNVYQAKQNLTAGSFDSSKWESRSLGDIGFLYRGFLPSGVDLNNYKSDIAGFYLAAYADEYANDPIGKNSRRMFFVYSTGQADNTMLTGQMAVAFAIGKIYTRFYTSDGGWSDWTSVDNPGNASYSIEGPTAVNVRYPRKTKTYGNPYENEPKVVTLLHFSDVHEDAKSFDALMSWANKRTSYYDNIICTGDIVDWYDETSGSGTDDYMDFWKSVKNAEKILITLGNHDAKNEAVSGKPGWERKTVARSRELYMYGIDTWGVTSPSGKTWWYKDYSNLRLIGLDTTVVAASQDDVDQQAWFETVLAGAKTAGLSVVVAQHYPPASASLVNCDFTADVLQVPNADYFLMPDGYQAKVQSFINGGGDFVCWISGHTHEDFITYNSNYPDQVFVVVTSLWNDLRTSDQARTEGTPSEVAANLIGFDVGRKLIKISRLGANSDYNLRPREYLVYNYSTKTVVRQASGV